MNEYRTAAGEGTAEILINKSKFIAHVFPVSREEDALEKIALVKKRHYTANHNVYAYRIGFNDVSRANDDGEPSRTAGMPILEVLRGERVLNTLVVVTRYFGGILLGTGGLVRAYGLAAKEGLKSAGIAEQTYCLKYELSIDYAICNKIKYNLEKENYAIIESLFTDIVTFTVVVKNERKYDFMETITNWCQGAELLELVWEGFLRAQY
jgi:uncharacterized YigZ family protein